MKHGFDKALTHRKSVFFLLLIMWFINKMFSKLRPVPSPANAPKPSVVLDKYTVNV